MPIDPLTLSLVPGLLTSAVVGGSVIANSSDGIIAKIWEWIFRASSERVLLQESNKAEFVYFLINLALEHEDEKHVRRIHLDQDTLFMLNSDDCPLKDKFFHADGRVKKRSILVPRKGFYIKSKKISNNDSDGMGWTWLHVTPLEIGGNLGGFDVWTSQWWWDWLSSEGLTANQANDAMRQTIEELMTFGGLVERQNKMNMENEEYRDFCVSLYDQGILHQKREVELQGLEDNDEDKKDK